MRAREARAAAALVDAVAAPEPPLPPVRETDAVAAFATWLAYAPRPNRLLLRTALLALAAAGFPRRDRTGRLALLHRLGHSPLAEGLRATAAVSYYGDAGVLETLHATPVPGTVVARVPDSAPARDLAASGDVTGADDTGPLGDEISLPTGIPARSETVPFVARITANPGRRRNKRA